MSTSITSVPYVTVGFTFAEPDQRLMTLLNTAAKVRCVSARLDQCYGPRRWRSHGDPVDELVATILSQDRKSVV